MTTNETTQKRSAPETFAENQKVGESFTLKRKISEGKIGVAWLAYDEESGKEVSLLFLREPIASDPRVLDELRAQVKANRQVVHPNVVRIHDLIEEDEWVAISSDAVEAEPLASLIKQTGHGCFEFSEVKPWMVTICKTLDDVHRANLLHRDLSPSNVLRTKSGEILIANFGISRIILDAVDRSQPGTEPGDYLAYVSPQQLDGELPARWDDVYSIGVLIHELLTGKPPFHSKDIVTQIRKNVPVSMAQRRSELGIIGGAIPENWEMVVASCLSKHTLQRPKSAREIGMKLGAEVGLVRTAPAAAPAPAFTPAAGKTALKAGPVEKDKEEKKSASSKPEPAVPTEKPPAGKSEPAAPAPSAGTEKTTEPPKEKPARQPSAPKEPEPSHEDILDEEVLWKGNTPRKKPIPGSPYAHLLEKVPEGSGSGTKKPGAFPVGKVIAAAVLIVVVLMLVHKSEKPGTKTASSPSPTPIAPIPPPIEMENPKAEKPIASGTATLPAKPGPLDTARTALDAIEKSHAEKLKLWQDAQAVADQAQKALDAKLAEVASLKKASQDSETLRQQREEAAARTAAEAEEAQKVAAEKVRLADEAKKAREEILGRIKEQQASQQKVDADLPALQKAAAEKQRIADEAATAEKDAQAHLQLQQLTFKQTEADAIAVPTPVPRPTPVATGSPAPSPTPSQNAPTIRDLPSPAPDVKPTPADVLAMFTQTPTPGAGTLTPLSSAGTPASAKTPPTIEEAEKKVVDEISQKQPKPQATPFVSTVPITYVPNPKSQIDKRMENSLGMKFAPVGDVLFCIWPVRVQDFEAFTQGTGFKGTAWRQPGFKQGVDHPVVNITWNDANAFCKWLTEKEQRSGVLAPNQIYRLPTDMEWSKAVGLPQESGKYPESRDMDVPDVYPWGTQWPPPAGAGNYTGEETGSDVAIKGYDDGYAWTAPVGSFNINKYGLYDMGGNVWQWCSDWWNGEQKQKVLRGASWYNGGLKLSLLSSCRLASAPDLTTDNYGFRVVVATEGKSKR